MLASVIQILGVLFLAVAAFLAWGVAPAVAVVGGGLVIFGLAAEVGARRPDGTG